MEHDAPMAQVSEAEPQMPQQAGLDPGATPVPTQLFTPPALEAQWRAAPPPEVPIHTPSPTRAARPENPRSRSAERLASAQAFATPCAPPVQAARQPAASPTEGPSLGDLMAAIQGLRGDMGGRMDRMEEAQMCQGAQITEMQQRAICHETATQQLIERVGALETRPASAPVGGSAPSSMASGTGGGRDPYKFDATIIRANVPGVASAASVWRTLQAAIAQARLPARDFEMLGSHEEDRLSRRFVVRCLGSPDKAAQLARAFTQSLRHADGTYTQLQVEAPSGAVAPLYVALDECPAHIVRKKATKRVAKALEAAGVRSRLHVSPRDGIVSVGWVPWAEIRFVPATMAAQVVWHDAAIRAADIDPDAARAAYDELAAEAGGPQRG